MPDLLGRDFVPGGRHQGRLCEQHLQELPLFLVQSVVTASVGVTAIIASMVPPLLLTAS